MKRAMSTRTSSILRLLISTALGLSACGKGAGGTAGGDGAAPDASGGGSGGASGSTAGSSGGAGSVPTAGQDGGGTDVPDASGGAGTTGTAGHDAGAGHDSGGGAGRADRDLGRQPAAARRRRHGPVADLVRRDDGPVGHERLVDERQPARDGDRRRARDGRLDVLRRHRHDVREESVEQLRSLRLLRRRWLVRRRVDQGVRPHAPAEVPRHGEDDLHAHDGRLGRQVWRRHLLGVGRAGLERAREQERHPKLALLAGRREAARAHAGRHRRRQLPRLGAARVDLVQGHGDAHVEEPRRRWARWPDDLQGGRSDVHVQPGRPHGRPRRSRGGHGRRDVARPGRVDSRTPR